LATKWLIDLSVSLFYPAVLYLLVLHLWTFALLMFHAHGFETVHGDFGAGDAIHHGPAALMQQQQMPMLLPPPALTGGR
jgi:hypothetical protein